MAPPSLSVWIQRSGRAGRNGESSNAYLLVEPSVFKVISKKKNSVNNDSDNDAEDEDEEAKPASEKTYQKKIEDSLREYIETIECRRQIADRYFNNPIREEDRDGEGL
jgi:superfamily II DNA helicase RecQ